MFPSNTEYSNFVQDQLLTSDDLNALFRFLDEQGRMSRTNLVGIGILCGLELRTKSDGTSITLTKGTGVTSEGYLVSLNAADYTHYINYEPGQEIYYEKFVDGTGSPRLQLWELKQEAAVEGSTPLTFDFLDGGGDEDHRKVVLVFVELYLELDKNCNPESCDDLGQTIHVNQRVLLARKMNVEDLGLDAGLGSSYFHDGYAALPRLPLPRFNVPATELTSAAGVFTAYKNLLPAADLAAFGAALASLWDLAKGSIAADYGDADPFAAWADAFAWLNAGSISLTDLITLQYVYDHYADLHAAYEELRQEGMRSIGACCPESGLFPRHLLLGKAIEAPHLVPIPLRHGFQPSPIHQREGELGRLRSLFRRLVLMAQAFTVPAPKITSGNDDAIRITPSRLGPDPLSVKAIPWYYPATLPVPGPLYSWWNYHKTRAGEADANLGYHALSYATRDDVKTPLAYDLEPYNFLRIEGHVGKPVAHVLSNLQYQVLHQRLPVHIVALALGNDASGTNIADPAALIALHTQFETLKAELLCCLRAQARYWATLDTGGAFKRPGKAEDYRVLQWLGGKRSFETAAGDPARTMVVMRAMAAAQGNAKASGAAPAAASRSNSVRSDSSVKDESAMEAKMVHSDDSALAQAIPEYLANTKKGQDLVYHLGEEAVAGIGTKWLRYLAQGDVNLDFMPAPDGPTLDVAQVEHWALIILDQIQEIIVAVQAENLLSLDVDTVETRRDALSEALKSLSELVDAHLAAQIPVAILKTYLSESYHDQAELLGTLMLGMSEADAHTLVRIFLNASDTEIAGLIQTLGRNQGDLTAQRAAVNAAYEKIDLNGMMIPFAKEVVAENDPFFTEMRDRLRNFACLCTVESFRQLRETLATWIEHVKGLNLFVNFARKHPGIQHKAGVPVGGTFVLVYHRAAKPGANQGAEAIAKKLGIDMEALGQGSVDPAILSAAQALSEGVVVADFYLPYVCCSDQAPIQFQVLENAAPPENVTLVLEPNAQTGTLDYSVGDSGFYEFAPFPPGGTLDNAIHALGVWSPSAGSWQFRPAKTAERIGTDDTLDIAFTYSRQGVSSTPVAVRVHNLPEATIINDSPRDAYMVGDKLILSSNVVRAETLRWVIEKPSGTENVVDVPQLAGYALDEEGYYSFVLLATQDATARMAVSNKISIFAQGAKVVPSLALEPNATTGDHSYSVGDRKSYAFSFSPADGKLEGASPEVGVTRNNVGVFVFSPAGAAAKLGGDDVLTVEFRYSVEGTRSDPVRALIFGLPSVTITPNPDRAQFKRGETVTWVASPIRAEPFTWNVTSPTGESTTTKGGRQLEVSLLVAGTWTFSLEVKQIETGWTVTSDVRTVEVKGDGGPDDGGDPGRVDTPDCGSLQPLVTMYDKLESIDGEGYALFRKRVLVGMGVEERFVQLRALANGSVEDQRAAFGVGTSSSWVSGLVGVMEQILELLANSRAKVSKTLLIAMYRLLGNLVLYINCISDKDLRDDQAAAMNRLVVHLEGGGGTVGIGSMGLDAKAMETVAAWKKDVENAFKNQSAAADAGRKPAYVQQLRTLFEAF